MTGHGAARCFYTSEHVGVTFFSILIPFFFFSILKSYLPFYVGHHSVYCTSYLQKASPLIIHEFLISLQFIARNSILFTFFINHANFTLSEFSIVSFIKKARLKTHIIRLFVSFKHIYQTYTHM